ncbi:hypothetical protein [Bordetella trematum]|uniref:hypothetical protein n=1 Tax=Bordetella trematum TaxID=123899 RepID=UPI00191C70DE|nr:hypothetical protein [Bordetella trematum]
MKTANMESSLPAGFEMLEPLVADWSLATQDARQARRKTSSEEDLRYFYDTLLPYLPEILKHMDQFPLGEFPPPTAKLFGLSLSLAEVAPHIELYGGSPAVPHAFEESRLVAEHGAHLY